MGIRQERVNSILDDHPGYTIKEVMKEYRLRHDTALTTDAATQMVRHWSLKPIGTSETKTETEAETETVAQEVDAGHDIVPQSLLDNISNINRVVKEAGGYDIAMRVAEAADEVGGLANFARCIALLTAINPKEEKLGEMYARKGLGPTV